MEGDFKGDFSRDSFALLKGFSRVLMQQGRVQLDADWNEQADIIWRFLRDLAKDLIGPHGAQGETSFKIIPVTDPKGATVPAQNFRIQSGHYYVDGMLVVNDETDETGRSLPPIAYLNQPHFSTLPSHLQPNGRYLVYLDVWERQITSAEDASIREVALGVGEPDTATRAQIVWQVKLLDRAHPAISGIQDEMAKEKWSEVVTSWKKIGRGRLQARALNVSPDDSTACITPPNARYRGAENQLYRVEIHTGATWPPTQGKSSDSGATFKWSRENGSVVFSYSALTPSTQAATIALTLDRLGRDERRFRLQKDDWVEFIDQTRLLSGLPGSLWQVLTIDPLTLEVTLGNNKNMDVPTNKEGVLRLWNYQVRKPTKGGLQLSPTDNAMLVVEDTWLNLEDGVQIWFQSGQGPYRTGDYWLIPARTATGDVLWPRHQDEPRPLPPHGVGHHYAPLALIEVDGQGKVVPNKITDLRYVFTALAKPAP